MNNLQFSLNQFFKVGLLLVVSAIPSPANTSSVTTTAIQVARQPMALLA
jgi:hypothetical protein